MEAAKIRADVARLAQAIARKDVDALMSYYAPDVLAFDLVAPLCRRGAGEIRRRAEEWFASFDGPIGYEVRRLEIAVSGDVAFTSSLNGIDGMGKNGRPIRMYIRVTTGLRKIDGRWQITHEHVSVPFDMHTMRAELTLEP